MQFSEYFTEPGEYTVTVNNNGKQTVKKITVGLSPVDEAYQMLELIRHYEETIVLCANDPSVDIFKLKQNALYVMYQLLETNSIVNGNSYVCQYLATRILDGDVLSLTDVSNIKNSLMQGNSTANEYFGEWEQKRKDERTSRAISLIPFIGGIKGFIDGVAGKDLITGRNLAWWESTLGIVCGALDVVAIGQLASVAVQEVRAASLMLRMEVMAGRISEAAAGTIDDAIRVAMYEEMSSGAVIKKFTEMSVDEWLRLEDLAHKMYNSF